MRLQNFLQSVNWAFCDTSSTQCLPYSSRSPDTELKNTSSVSIRRQNPVSWRYPLLRCRHTVLLTAFHRGLTPTPGTVVDSRSLYRRFASNNNKCFVSPQRRYRVLILNPV